MHLLVIAFSGVVAARQLAHEPPPPPSRGAGGDTFDVDGLVDGEEAGEQAIGAAPAAAEPAPAAEEASNPVPKDQPEPEKVDQSKRHGKKRRHPHREAPAAGSADAASSSGPGSPSASASASPPGDGPGEGKTYGPAGAPRGVQNLATAFARALPSATYAQAVWRQLPVGEVGKCQATFEVAEGGTIVELSFPEETPASLRAMVQATRPLLGGEFALGDYGAVAAGRETLAIEVSLSDVAPPTGIHDEREVLELGHDPPSEKKPGQAHFILASGRRFDAIIRVVKVSAR